MDAGTQTLDPEISWNTVAEKIRCVRKQMGLSQDDAARALNLSRPTLSAMENGHKAIDSLILKRLAILYRRDVAWFLEADFPLPNDLLSIQQRQLDQKLGSLSSDDVATISRFWSFCTNLTWIRGMLNQEARISITSRPLSWKSRQYVANASADEQRVRLNLDDAPIGDTIFTVVDGLGLPVYRARLTNSEISGIVVYHPSAGPVIFINALQAHWRQVFSLAHEYGHLVFHSHDLPVVCRVFSGELEPGEAKRETYINEFAAEFLMPEVGIRRSLSSLNAGEGPLSPEHVVFLHRRFGVSFKAMLYRLRRLRIVNDDNVTRVLSRVNPLSLVHRSSYSAKHDTERNVDREMGILDRFPGTFVDSVLMAFETGIISNGRAAEILECNRAEFDDFCLSSIRLGHEELNEAGVEAVVG